MTPPMDPIKSVPPFSYLVKVGHVSANPVTVRIAANESECRDLAKLWSVLSVIELKAELQIARWKRDGLRIRGKVEATIVQACVVTLEPVTSVIEEHLDQLFVPCLIRVVKWFLTRMGRICRKPLQEIRLTAVTLLPNLPHSRLILTRAKQAQNLRIILKARMQRTRNRHPLPY
jgi:hypothetical protein